MKKLLKSTTIDEDEMPSVFLEKLGKTIAKLPSDQHKKQETISQSTPVQNPNRLQKKTEQTFKEMRELMNNLNAEKILSEMPKTSIQGPEFSRIAKLPKQENIFTGKQKKKDENQKGSESRVQFASELFTKINENFEGSKKEIEQIKTIVDTKNENQEENTVKKTAFNQESPEKNEFFNLIDQEIKDVKDSMNLAQMQKMLEKIDKLSQEISVQNAQNVQIQEKYNLLKRQMDSGILLGEVNITGTFTFTEFNDKVKKDEDIEKLDYFTKIAIINEEKIEFQSSLEEDSKFQTIEKSTVKNIVPLNKNSILVEKNIQSFKVTLDIDTNETFLVILCHDQAKFDLWDAMLQLQKMKSNFEKIGNLTKTMGNLYFNAIVKNKIAEDKRNSRISVLPDISSRKSRLYSAFGAHESRFSKSRLSKMPTWTNAENTLNNTLMLSNNYFRLSEKKRRKSEPIHKTYVPQDIAALIKKTKRPRQKSISIEQDITKNQMDKKKFQEFEKSAKKRKNELYQATLLLLQKPKDKRIILQNSLSSKVLTLKNGFMLLKYGKYGNPKERLIYLTKRSIGKSKSMEYVIESKDIAKKTTTKFIVVCEIKAIIENRLGANFKKIKINDQNREKLSFSIVGPSRSLDLESDSLEKKTKFIEALKAVWENEKKEKQFVREKADVVLENKPEQMQVPIERKPSNSSQSGSTEIKKTSFENKKDNEITTNGTEERRKGSGSTVNQTMIKTQEDFARQWQENSISFENEKR